MAAVSPVPVNSAVLAWAREESGYSPERIARSLQVPEERLLAWEQGQRQPTLKQVQKLAHVFRRPLSLFFLPRPPQLTPLAADYRRLPGIDPGHESPELRLALRQMLARRDNALNLIGELGEAVPEFHLRARLDERPADVGARLRGATGVTDEQQAAWPNEWRAWHAWRASVEALGVLVFQFTRVPVEEVRGLALLHSPLPVAAVNGREVIGAKPYTLLHEVVHLMLAAELQEAPAISDRRSADEWLKVERFAEAAASHALVPEERLRPVVAQLGLQQATWGLDEVRRLARQFKITPLAAATRLRESELMSWSAYQSWRQAWQEFIDSLPPRRGGFATPVEKALGRGGRPFARLVLDALEANRITSVDASRYLDLKFEHFEDLRENLRQSGGAAGE